MPDLTETSPPSSPATPSPAASSPTAAAPSPPDRAPGSASVTKPASPKAGPTSPQATPPRPPEPPRPMPAPPPPPPPPPPPSKVPLVLGVIAFLLLAGVAVWQWTELEDLRGQVAAQTGDAAQSAKLDALAADLHATQQQVQALAQKPETAPAAASPPVDLAPIEAQLKALSQRQPPPPADLAPIDARIAALEQKPLPPPVDLAPLEARIKALADRPPPPPVDLTPLQTRLATLENKPPPDDSELRGRVAELTKQLEAVSAKFASAQTQLSAAQAQSGERLARSGKLDAALVALTAGKPVGEIADAPAALGKFATAAPPTEASLRLSFEAAAKAAESASDPAAGSTDIGDRIWQRVQTLVTVRHGDTVVVGPPANVVIAEARKHLVAGDLAGAVAALDRLDPSAARAMAGWRAEAQALLDARTALAGLVAGGAATP